MHWSLITARQQNGTIRVLIADDQNSMREAIRRRLQHVEDIEVVGESPNLDQALLDAGSLLPDVVIMNDYLPPMTSPHATALFRKQGFSAAILWPLPKSSNRKPSSTRSATA